MGRYDRRSSQSSRAVEVVRDRDEPIIEIEGSQAAPLMALDQTFDEVHAILSKRYLQQLSLAPIAPYEQEYPRERERRFRWLSIDNIVYEQGTFFVDKFSMLLSAIHGEARELALLLVKKPKQRMKLYLGACDIEKGGNYYASEILYASLSGIFPGINLEYGDPQEGLAVEGCAVSAVSAVGSLQDERKESFVQGLERLIDATVDIPEFTAMIIAERVSESERLSIIKGYEDTYSMLVPFASVQLSHSQETSLSLTQGESESISSTLSQGISRTITHGSNSTESQSSSHAESKTKGTSHSCGLSGGLSFILAANASYQNGRTSSTGTTDTQSESSSRGTSYSKSDGSNETKSEGRTTSTNTGETKTQGQGQSLTITRENRTVKHMLDAIDEQISRLDTQGSNGLWNCATYLITPTTTSAKQLANIYRGCVLGNEGSLEVSAVNTWGRERQKEVHALAPYLQHCVHPRFIVSEQHNVSAGSLVNSYDLAIHMSLPQRSVPGVLVQEKEPFAREVVTKRFGGYGSVAPSSGLLLGQVQYLGKLQRNSPVHLELKTLSMHTFITGSTGSGKSNTVYQILGELDKKGVKFLVIESAKGEYKDVLGQKGGIAVYGTNPHITPLLRINPFSFCREIHVQEHIDKLVEIFNACWPMYAAMPAVLKMAIERAYIKSGWDLDASTSKYGLFPNFQDVLLALRDEINLSEYSDELKSNYKGALETRVESLTRGITGMLFTSNELAGEELFDNNVIVDLSRVGSLETKALIMGLIIMKLNQYRISQRNGSNQELRHVTVLEEAHNLLKRTSTTQSQEGANLMGKSVEMISNSIAEMRTYGEGFIIVDQSPSALDPAAIRNTNTKIVMALPDKDDREVAGKSMGLSDEQIHEISKLSQGEAIAYQSIWEAPVQCMVEHYQYDKAYLYPRLSSNHTEALTKARRECVSFLLSGVVGEPMDFPIEDVEDSLKLLENLSARDRIVLRRAFDEYNQFQSLSLWSDENIRPLSHLVASVLGLQSKTKGILRGQSVEALDEEVKALIEAQVGDLSRKLLTQITHCVLLQCSSAASEVALLSAWCEYQRNIS